MNGHEGAPRSEVTNGWRPWTLMAVCLAVVACATDGGSAPEMSLPPVSGRVDPDSAVHLASKLALEQAEYDIAAEPSLVSRSGLIRDYNRARAAGSESGMLQARGYRWIRRSWCARSANTDQVPRVEARFRSLCARRGGRWLPEGFCEASETEGLVYFMSKVQIERDRCTELRVTVIEPEGRIDDLRFVKALVFSGYTNAVAVRRAGELMAMGQQTQTDRRMAQLEAMQVRGIQVCKIDGAVVVVGNVEDHSDQRLKISLVRAFNRLEPRTSIRLEGPTTIWDSPAAWRPC